VFVREFEDVKKVSDIQIQTSLYRLAFDLTFANDVYAGNAEIFMRVRIMNLPDGPVEINDLMSLVHRLEIEHNATGEGMFEYSKLPGDAGYHLRGSFAIGVGGSIGLKNGSYLSIDIEGVQPFSGSIETIDHWKDVQTVQTVEPFTVTGTTKDIELGGVDTVAIRPAKLKELIIRQNGKSVPLTSSELAQLALVNNDVVSVDTVAGTAVYGYRMFSCIGVNDATDMKITPTIEAGQDTFYQYLLRKSLVRLT
jgi:hypothetical protein